MESRSLFGDGSGDGRSLFGEREEEDGEGLVGRIMEPRPRRVGWGVGEVLGGVI